MDKKYWDGMARQYEREIFSVLHADTDRRVAKAIGKVASQKKSVVDVGCGIGHFLSVLSSAFGRVYANDISPDLLKRAQETHGHLSNIRFLAGDIREAFRGLPRADVVLSVNSAIASSVTIHLGMLKTMSGLLKPGGHLVLVVPALESALLVDVRYAEWKRRNGMLPERAQRSVYKRDPEGEHRLRQGVVPVDGVMTRHYFSEELEVLLGEVGLDVLSTEKIPYPWGTEFEAPPRWMKAPYPWDWLLLARKKR